MAGGRKKGASPPLLPLLVLCALLSGGLASLGTVAPDRDTASYVHMARCFAGGEAQEALAAIFPPLHPLLLAGVGRLLGCETPEAWWHAAQVWTGLCHALSVLILYQALKPLGLGFRWITGLWLSLGLLPAWQVADGLSEPLFRCLVGGWLAAHLRGRTLLMAATAGLAFVTRPEAGILLPATFLSALSRKNAAWAAASLLSLVPAGIYLGLRAVATGELSLLPLGGFMAPLSVLGEEDLGRALGHVAREGGRFLVQGFDGLGYLALPCLLLGLPSVLGRGREAQAPAGKGLGLPALAALLALAVVPFFFGNRRFWTSWLPLLLPVAAIPLCRWPRPALLLVLVFLLPHALRIPRPRRTQLQADRALGRHFRILHPGERIATDLPRFLFFSGRPPLPPRSLEAGELMEEARSARFVVSLEKRGKLDRKGLAELGFRPYPLPPELEGPASGRGLRVFWKP